MPYRTSNTCAANTLDAQSAYESMMSLWAVVQGGGNFIMHAAGWMEGGLTASFEKFILDVDMLQMVAELLAPLDVSPDALAMDAIRDVGPGGHYFGTAHTLSRYETAFYSPILSDWRNFESWSQAGQPTTYDHANRVWKETLAGYEAAGARRGHFAKSSMPLSPAQAGRRRADRLLIRLGRQSSAPSRARHRRGTQR
jgi:trimethylamine--corrinoid protein Co-methyltransferase